MLIRRDFAAAFEKCDLLLTPTSPTVAFRIGELVDDPLAMYACDLFTLPVNLSGLPAISLPCGRSEGLPVGLHLAGPAFSENRLLAAAQRPVHEPQVQRLTPQPAAVLGEAVGVQVSGRHQAARLPAAPQRCRAQEPIHGRRQEHLTRRVTDHGFVAGEEPQFVGHRVALPR